MKINVKDSSTIRQYSKIRYDKKLNARIDNVLRKYNSKINRLARQKSDYILPQKVTKDNLMDVSYTRSDLNRRLNNLERFNKRGAEKTVMMKGGYAISSYELDYLKREKSRVKRKLTKEIKRYETVKPTNMGVETARTFAQMGDTSYLNTLARYQRIDINIEELSLDELKGYRELLYSAGKNRDYLAEGFRANFIDMFTRVGYYVNYSKSKIERIANLLSELPADKFYELYRTEKTIKAVADYYYALIDGKINPDEIREEIFNLYDNLLSSLPTILQDYK